MDIDVSRFSREAIFGNGQNKINLASIVYNLRDTLSRWARDGLVKEHQSFGFAIAHPNPHRPVHLDDRDDPYSIIWFVVGWGDEADRYVANAVRKLRPALRYQEDTLKLRIFRPDVFRDVVPSVDKDGNFPWGDFPWGGATFVRVGDLILPCAVSCLKEVEDDAAAKTIGGHIGSAMLQRYYPTEFA